MSALTATEKQDHHIVVGKMHVIWSRGQEKTTNVKFYSQDELKYHGGGPSAWLQVHQFPRLVLESGIRAISWERLQMTVLSNLP